MGYKQQYLYNSSDYWRIVIGRNHSSMLKKAKHLYTSSGLRLNRDKISIEKTKQKTQLNNEGVNKTKWKNIKY